jgi:hypothetical protein
LDAGRHYAHLLGHGRLSRAFGAPHAQVLICFLFIQIPKMPLSSLYNYKKKNHYEKTKRHLDSRFKFFAFTGIFIISLCVLIVYYFYIWSKKTNCLCIIITKKIIVKRRECPLTSNLIFASNDILIVLLCNRDEKRLIYP